MPPSSASLRHYLFPLLIILILICTFPPSVLSASRCANCGSTPVPYPLSTSPNCGDPLYKIQCNAGKLSFNSLNNTYPITSISPNNQRLTIQNSPFIPNTCVTSDIISEGVELDQTLPFNITSSNTILYLNCSQLLLSSPLNCTSTSLCHTYINGSLNSNSGDGACASAPLCCTFRAGGSTTSYQIRVRSAGCRAYRSFVNLDATVPVSQWPQPGLELEWVSPLEPICTGQSDCQSDSVCGPDSSSNRGLRRCFCNSGFHWDAITGLCSHLCDQSKRN